MANDDDTTNSSNPVTFSQSDEAPDPSWWEAVDQSEDVADFEPAELLHSRLVDLAQLSPR